MKGLLIGLLGFCACSVVMAKETPATPATLKPIGVGVSCDLGDSIEACANRAASKTPYTLVTVSCESDKSAGCVFDTNLQKAYCYFENFNTVFNVEFSFPIRSICTAGTGKQLIAARATPESVT